MRKTYALFSLLLLCFAVATPQAAAQYQQGEEALTSITPGQKVLLQNGRQADEVNYLKYYADPAAQEFWSSKVGDETIFVFEEAGEESGEMTYYLKNIANNAYLEDADYTYSEVYISAYTTDKSRAARLLPANTVASDGFTEALILHRVPDYGGTYYDFTPFAFFGPGFNRSFAGYEYYNSWIIYEAKSLGGKGQLGNILETYTPNGVTEESWKVGTLPGCISQELYDALLKAYNQAQTAYNDNEASVETCEKAGAELTAAYNNALAGVVQLQEGYYFFANYATQGYAYAAKNGEVYDMHWRGMEIPEKYDAALKPYIWKLESAGEASIFRFYNPYYDRYMTYSTSQNTAILLTVRKDAENISTDNTGTFKVAYQNEATAGVGGYFNILNFYAGSRAVLGLFSNNAIGYTDGDDHKSDMSLWNFIPVPDNFLTALDEERKQEELNGNLQKLYDSSCLLIEKTKAYTGQIVTDGLLDTPGLIESCSTNAQEPTEGEILFAYDNDISTFFHTVWSDKESTVTDFHYLQASLAEAIQNFAVKFVRRQGVRENLSPRNFSIYASNDAEAEEWTKIGDYIAVYNHSVKLFEEADDLPNTASVTFVEMPAAYKYLRFVVTSTIDGSESNMINNVPYFNLAEIGVFAAAYDKENSAYEFIDATVKANFENLIAQAEKEISADAATQQTYDALLKAYEAFDAQFADPQALRDIIADARSFYDNAVEGEELGTYAYGSTEAFEAALANIEKHITDLLTPEQFSKIEGDINDALADFNKALIKPEEGKLYYIQSDADNPFSYGHYLMAVNNDEGNVQVSNSTDGSSEDNPEMHLNYMWKFIKQADGTYHIMNAATGTYIGGGTVAEKPVTMSYEPHAIGLRSARSYSLAFNFEISNGLFGYTQTAMQNFVLSPTAKGSDGGSYLITPADYQASYLMNVTSNPQIITLPFEVAAVAGDARYYTVLGLNGNKVELKEYADNSVIAAGMPFIVTTGDGIKVVGIYVNEDSDGAAIQYVLSAQTANGLVGTLRSTRIEQPFCIIRNGKIDLPNTSGSTVSANSGYFDLSKMEKTSEAGDLSIAVNESALVGIDEVVLNAGNNVREGIFNLQGVRLQSTKNLPKGVYIVNGRKVIKK